MPTPVSLPLILEFLMAADREFAERPLTVAEREQLEREDALTAAAWAAIDIDLAEYRPSLWQRLRQRAAEWWCARFGHDYEGGSGFNGEYTQHWYQCRRCGDGGSD